tara:strand:- start:42 stop:233 length:192 start_codon:yes stop_codon:yes gene_type:complete
VIFKKTLYIPFQKSFNIVRLAPDGDLIARPNIILKNIINNMFPLAIEVKIFPEKIFKRKLFKE